MTTPTQQGGIHRGETGAQVEAEFQVEFTYETSDSGPWLKGGATLERLDFGVGQGERQSTTMVANVVEVRFAIKMEPPT